MSKVLQLRMSDEVYEAVSHAASAVGATPSDWVLSGIERRLFVPDGHLAGREIMMDSDRAASDDALALEWAELVQSPGFDAARWPIDERAYKQWRPLHARVARGGALTEEEREYYDLILTRLDLSEVLGPTPEDLADADPSLNPLRQENAHLRARRRDLDKEIERLENALTGEVSAPAGRH